jgi:serine/threonine protein kinase
MGTTRPNKDQIFHAAAELSDSDERLAFLEQACEGDSVLREEIEELLEHDGAQDSLLDQSAPGLPPTVDQSITERPGTVIGRYKLLEQIGEGGFGMVFMAEQQEPIVRKVALKIIKPGMDTKEVIARFEAERQALAMMDHANIARVFDAGTTPSGRPYFVMELVRGIAITDYCDKTNLSTKDRLVLFESVCSAVQHAHQKGIIHRDIKPSNVLVTLHDGKSVVKVIDFGIAKAINQRLTERTLFTRFAQFIGTPMYMSPEQAEVSGLDIDTRTDIYSLGVLLYELLTGATPFDKTRFCSAAEHEIRRIIREEEPPRPSTKISTLGDNATEICARRRSEQRRLSAMFRGELDWVVMKALEKERGRRYDTASNFAADIRRFLDGEAIEARPPSAVYRLRKTVARHRVAVATTTIVMLTLIMGVVTSTWFALRLQATLRALQHEVIEKVVLNAQAGNREGTKRALQLAEQSRVPPATLQMLRGIVHYYNGENEQAIEDLTAVVEIEQNNVTARAMLSLAHIHNGEWNEYVREIIRVQEILVNQDRRDRQDYEALILGCALLYSDTESCVEMLRETADRHPEWVLARGFLGGAKAHRALELRDAGLANEALEDTRLAQQLLPENRVVALYNSWTHRVAIYFKQQRGERYEDLAKEALDGIKPLLKNHEDYIAGAYNIAETYGWLGDEEAAIRILKKAVGNADRGWLTSHLVSRLLWCGRFDEARELVESVDAQSVDVRYIRACLFAGIPEKREEAERLANALLDEEEAIDAGSCAIEVFCILGQDTKVRSESRRCLDILPERSIANWMPKESLEFHTGIAISEFDKDCGDSPVGRMEFYYHVAMRRLCEGDRAGAIEYFDLCTKSSLIDGGYYHMAKAFKRLLEENPDWANNPVRGRPLDGVESRVPEGVATGQ